MKIKRVNVLAAAVSVCLLLSLPGCLDIGQVDEVEWTFSGAEYALPLVNSTLTLETVLDGQVENAGIRYDENGLTIIEYSSDVIQKKAYDVFKPIVFPGAIFFDDSIKNMRFDLIDNYVVEKGIIRGDSIRFGFRSSFDETVFVDVMIREVQDNGQIFRHSLVLPAQANLISPLFSLRGYSFESPDNQLTFVYDARTANGERVLLDEAYFEFTYFVFDYVQGFLGKNTQKLYDHQIKVNIFELWESGLLEFDDPKIRVQLDNSFGFPVKAVINHFTVTNLLGETIQLESTVFDDDIVFDYPSLDEVGVVKSSEFVFDKQNSNFATAFNQKVVEVSYDVDAVANPDNDPSAIGFFQFDSYYKLNVAVELPMRFKAESFQLSDHFPIDSIPVDLGLVESFELKCYITNLFPVDVHTQLYFLDQNDQLLDSLFTEGEQHFPAATLNPDGSISPAGNTTPMYFQYDEDRLDLLRDARKLAPRVRLSTENNPDEWTSITKNQGLDVKIGVKFKFN